ncbi:MAG TPA: hypothetical protein VE442_01505 [Jatrophihabitans sp.]|jgi:hypothetical protein|nr:hypothetical protein [Jatrophihabitans sp.]
MNASFIPGRLAATTTLAALATGGFFALAAPAQASGASTVALTNGTVTVTGTAARDLIGITMNATRVVVDLGLDGTVDAHFARSQVTAVRVFAGDGDDGVNLAGAGEVRATINGGAGRDGIGIVGHIGETGADDAPTTLNGNGGADDLFVATPGQITVHAGAGDDRVEGGGAGIGHETISLGDGNDRFVSSLNAFVGARGDVVDGGAGQNAMVVNGSFASESISLSAKAGRLLVEHDLRDFIDADNIQDVSWFGFGGLDEGGNGDQVLVNDLSGTDVTRFTPDFSAPQEAASPNNSADILAVRGTAGDDHVAISGSGANITIAGLTPTVAPVQLNSQDTIRIETVGGQDTVDTTGLLRGLVHVEVV